METLKRKYNVSDLNMLEKNKTMRQHFIDEQAEFSGFDIDFATPFETGWQSAIDAAEAILPDEVIQDQLQQLTADVDATMEAARQKFQSSKYFIEKAFPNRTGVRNEFGYDNYDGIRKSQTGMFQFMQTFFKTATKYATELAAEGYDAAAVTEIETLGNALNDANIAQEKFKGTRVSTTEERIIAHNAAWDIMVQVSKAGKIIFMNNPAKYQLFLLPASSESGEDISISGTVTSTDNTPIEGATVNIAALNIDTETDSNGKYVFGNLDAGSYELEFSADGYAPTTVENVQVTDGETTETNVTLNEATGSSATISGTVQDSGTLTGIDGATVSLTNADGTISTTTDPAGNYTLTLNDLSSSVDGTLEASASGYLADSRAVTVNPGDSVVEDFALNPST